MRALASDPAVMGTQTLRRPGRVFTLVLIVVIAVACLALLTTTVA
jgi:hypothetical protein